MKARSIIVSLAIGLAIAAVGCETSTNGSSNGDEARPSAETEPVESAGADDEGTTEASADEPDQAQAAAPKPNQDDANQDQARSDSTPESVELDMPNQARPFEGIVTAGQPTNAQFEKLDDAGVSHVISFRTDEEPVPFDEQATADDMGLNYTQIPIGGADDLNRKNVEAFDAALDDGDGDTLVHCGSSNRVGAMFALRAFWLEGKGVEQALEVGKKAGLDDLETAVREKIE